MSCRGIVALLVNTETQRHRESTHIGIAAMFLYSLQHTQTRQPVDISVDISVDSLQSLCRHRTQNFVPAQGFTHSRMLLHKLSAIIHGVCVRMHRHETLEKDGAEREPSSPNLQANLTYGTRSGCCTASATSQPCQPQRTMYVCTSAQ